MLCSESLGGLREDLSASRTIYSLWDSFDPDMTLVEIDPLVSFGEGSGIFRLPVQQLSVAASRQQLAVGRISTVDMCEADVIHCVRPLSSTL